MRNPNLLILPILAMALSACGGLTATGPKKGLAGMDLVTANNGGAINSIVGYSPGTGTYAAVPSTITISFTSANLNAGDAAAVSTYSVNCGGNQLAAQGVTYNPGFNSVAVQLPSILGLVDGTMCVFSVSISMRDGSGNFITGQHTITYTISSNGQSTSTGGVWNEAATPQQTSSIGSAVGQAFNDQAGSGMAVSGLLLNGTNYVNGIAGLWSNGFNSTTTSQGPTHGATAGGFTQLTCPTGYRLTGIFGRSGAYIDSLGITCKTQDQSQTYTSPSQFGGSGGSSYALNCPAGMFVTDLNGKSDSYLEQLSLGCR